MSTMIAAADEYGSLKRGLDRGEPEPMSTGFVTFCDPCVMPRKVDMRMREEQLKPERVAQIKFPADENGYPLEMEIHEPQLPTSAVPHLRNRFSQRTAEELMREHDGREEKLDEAGAQEHLQHGWSKENDKKFRENEELLRAVFGGNWDPRYGRTRVRSSQTGEMLTWGDGNLIYDSSDGRPPPLPVEAVRPPAEGSGSGSFLSFLGVPELEPEPAAPPAADEPEQAAVAVLRRGDTEVFEFKTKPVAYTAVTTDVPAAFPHFPPPRMHVAGSMRPLVPPPPEESRARPAYLHPPAQPPPQKDVMLSADFGVYPEDAFAGQGSSADV